LQLLFAFPGSPSFLELRYQVADLIRQNTAIATRNVHKGGGGSSSKYSLENPRHSTFDGFIGFFPRRAKAAIVALLD
jgi:hypothetical protein